MRRRLTRKIKNKQIVIISTICLLLVMVSGYAAFSTNLSITAKGNIKEKTRVIQAWKYQATTDFHEDYYKEKIISATFLDNNNVPSNAIESWNVSDDKENGGVMAWIVSNNTDNTKYDLYIGARGGVIANTDSGHIFNRFPALQSINFNDNFDTRNATNMQGMFSGSVNLSTVDLTNFDTSNVTNMNSMFSICSSLIELDLSSFDTRNVTTMNSMFSFWDGTKKVSSSLKNIIFGENFITSKVNDMASMFYGCSVLENLDLSFFDTNNVTTMFQMFNKCTNLTDLNLCSFDTTNVTNMTLMFGGTLNLKQITVGPSWTISNANTEAMFYNSGVSSVTTGKC